MKKITSLILAVLLSVGAFTPAVIQTGCTTSQQKVAYTTLLSMGQAVDAAEKSYLDLVIKGTIPQSTLSTESKAYSDFQASYRVAVIAAQGATNIQAPQNVLDLGNSFLALVAQLSKH